MNTVVIACLAVTVVASTPWIWSLSRDRRDTLSEELIELAGPDAIAFGVFTNYLSREIEEKVVAAYLNSTPFWARSERHYQNIHNMSEEWDISEGYVLTPQMEYLHLRRKPETRFRSKQRTRYRWDVIEIGEGYEGFKYLTCRGKKTRLGYY